MLGLIRRKWREMIAPQAAAPPPPVLRAAEPPVATMSPRLAVNSVFPIGAYELRHTYIARALVEKAVQDQLRHQNAIILFSGPSKSGKTVLCHRFATGLPKAHLHVFATMTGAEFWDALRQAIEAPEIGEFVTHGATSSRTEIDTRAAASGGAFGIEAEGEARWNRQWTQSQGQVRRVVIPTGGRMGVLNFLQKNPHTIIVDDYHWMNPAIAPEVFPPLKQVLGWGSRVILISVSRSAFPTIGDFGDFTGRFIRLEMPSWTAPEIRQIAERGFPLLNLKVSQQTINRLTSCAYLSPLLMQGLCSQLCHEADVQETLDEPRSIELDARGQVGDLAARFAEPLTQNFDPILSDPGSRIWKTRDGRALSLAELLVLGISHTRPFEAFPLDALVKRLTSKVLQKPVPATLAALLVRRIAEIQVQFGGERGDRSPIYYDPVAKTVTIVDPYFKLWARWVRGTDLSGKLFPKE